MRGEREHAAVRDLLPDFARGTLTATSRAAVAAHVARCGACRTELGLIRNAQTALARTPSIDVERVVQALPRPPKVTRSGRRRGAWAHAGGWRRAAVIATIVGVGAAVGVDTRERWAVRSPGSASAPESGGLPGARPAGAGGPIVRGVVSGKDTLGARPADVDRGGLVLAAGVQELDDVELDALLRDIEALDPLPSEEPLPVLPAFELEPGEAGA